MHLLVYRTRPGTLTQVVHAHPVTATGFAAAGMSLEEPLVSEIVISLGAVPRWPSTELRAHLNFANPCCPSYPTMTPSLMANHGVVTYGPDLLSAYMKMETVGALCAHRSGQPTSSDARQAAQQRRGWTSCWSVAKSTKA